MLGVAGKLVKNVVYTWRQDFEKKSILPLPIGCQNNTFGFQGSLGIKNMLNQPLLGRLVNKVSQRLNRLQ
jgi:hypothetical protein